MNVASSLRLLMCAFFALIGGLAGAFSIMLGAMWLAPESPIPRPGTHPPEAAAVTGVLAWPALAWLATVAAFTAVLFVIFEMISRSRRHVDET